MVNFYTNFIACSTQANVSLVAGEFSTLLLSKIYENQLPLNILVFNKYLLWKKHKVSHMQSLLNIERNFIVRTG